MKSAIEQISEWRVDAERYRKLKERLTVRDKMVGYCLREWTLESGCEFATLDAAIDSLLSTAAPGSGGK